MNKKFLNLLVILLIFSTVIPVNPLDTSASNSNSEENKIELVSEKDNEYIDIFKEEKLNNVLYSVPNNSEVLLLDTKNKSSLVRYTYINEEEKEVEVEGFVSSENISNPKSQQSEDNEESDENNEGKESKKDLKTAEADQNDSDEDKSEKDNNEEFNNDEVDETKETFSDNPEEPDVLKKGVRDDRVITLKENLATLGFPVPGNGTSLFGKETEKKVKEFQDYYGMTADGVVGNNTEAKIESILSSPLQKGKRHEDTVQLKKDLKFLGSPVPGKGTTLYGSETEKVIKSFQKKNNLAVNGIADEVTLAKIEELKEVPLKRGMRREDVKILKENLERLGFTVPGDGTNLFGKKTEAKVKEFQNYYGLKVTGTVADNTVDKIETILNSPLQKGKRHEDTVQLKKDLKYLGSPVPGKGTTLFGSKTEKVVKSFQKKNGLAVNGIADEVTLEKIEELKEGPLKKGMRREDVKSLKKDLAKLGFTVPGNGTNLYGKDTEKKVKEFQKYYGMKADGVAGESTFEKIETVLNSPLQKGKRHEDTVQLKKDLKYLGSPVPGKGTTLFGSETEKVVKSFQKKHGLAVNGIADKVTLAKIEELKEAPLSRGMRREDVKQLKKDLAKLDFAVPGNGTNLYGKNTEKKVKAFQKYYGIKQTGTVNKKTQNKIDEVLNSPLQKDKRHADTKKLKTDLKKLGFKVPGNGTTLYGTKTEKKVKEFQKYYSLRVNGIADSVTLKKIKDVLNSPLQNGKRHADTKKLKKDLAEIGYKVPGNGTTLYGDKTEKQVRKLQKDHGLAISGIADEVTLQKIKDLKDKKNAVKIYIDPGHGGGDPGASGYGLQEKTLTLDIAKRIGKNLDKYKNVEIKYSRTTDKSVSLKKRTDEANAWGADYFLSVHINSFSGATGFESYIHNGKRGTADAKAKQNSIHSQIVKDVNVRDRGKKTQNFHVLRESNMSAILLEYLFINTKSDNDKLRKSSFREDLAKSTAEGTAKAFNLKKK